MAMPLLGHLDPDFTIIMAETQQMLRQAFHTTNPVTFPVSATGMAGMETCLVNLIEPGDRVVVGVIGFFGQRLVEVARRCDAQLTVVERPWGNVLDLDQLRDTLTNIRPKVLAVVHSETSTGTRQPIEQLGKLCHEFDTLLVVDTVTSLGCVPVHVDAWEIDATFSCSQKGLGCPPGMAPVTFSPRAVEAIQRRKTPVRSWYFDVSTILKYWGADRAYHHTGPITSVYALREGLRILLEEGLEARWARQAKHAAALAAGLTAMGFQYASVEAHRLPQLHAVFVPQGVDDLAVRKQLLSEFGLEIGGGLGEFKGKVWRIGLMGYGCKTANVTLALAALERALHGLVPPGAGLAAALRSYAQ
jgi:alanine-glyoxylate transaminase/serine-glyoxylate transaminase/serine-pyruvate transaminase